MESTRASTCSASTRTCLCAPTSHPGSFRCSLHRGARRPAARSAATASTSAVSTEAQARQKARSMRAVLMQIIRPSSHDLYRRRNFQPRPSRFCLMNNGNGHGVEVV